MLRNSVQNVQHSSQQVASEVQEEFLRKHSTLGTQLAADIRF